MHTFSELPTRRRTALLFHAAFTGLVILLGLTSLGIENEWLIWALFMLPFLGLFQLINALYNAFRGSRMQLIYFFAGLLFLLLYIGILSEGIPLFRQLFGFGEEQLLFIPVVMATIYCVILYIDHPDRYRSRDAVIEDTLDGGISWEKAAED